eukprot:TRINITY_DN0_c1_g2_i1.p1 TRINITY_DN0_c1_g2~~TRINITY_DN0_c1_g2_i1.p1  ORF type:complete len:213 (+),score=48.67 TRINITY_DN0_c1_g2_i1:186-824(+)
MSLEVYFHPVSQPARSVLIFLKEHNIEFTPHFIDILAGQQKGDDFLSVTPFGLVPCIREGEWMLNEAAAIMGYLATKTETTWVPADAKLKAEMDRWMHWNHTATRKSTHLLRKKIGGNVTEEDIAPVKEVLAFLDGQLEGRDFLVGDSLTLADVFILPEIDQIELFQFWPNTWEAYPNIAAWLNNVKAALPTYQENIAPVQAIIAQLAGAQQ